VAKPPRLSDLCSIEARRWVCPTRRNTTIVGKFSYAFWVIPMVGEMIGWVAKPLRLCDLIRKQVCWWVPSAPSSSAMVGRLTYAFWVMHIWKLSKLNKTYWEYSVIILSPIMVGWVAKPPRLCDLLRHAGVVVGSPNPKKCTLFFLTMTLDWQFVICTHRPRALIYRLTISTNLLLIPTSNQLIRLTFNVFTSHSAANWDCGVQ